MTNWFNQGTYESLLREARMAAWQAYCPYSKFHVGAAGLFLNDRDHHEIVSGCNIENSSYGLTICAERSTVFKAVTAGYSRLMVLAVTCPDAADDAEPKYRMPCGACRQVMMEFACPETLIVVDKVGIFRLDELLPKAFTL